MGHGIRHSTPYRHAGVGMPLFGANASKKLNLYGSGIDGDQTFAATQSALARTMYYNTLILDNGGVLPSGGFPIFAKTRIHVKSGGKIVRSGNPAS